MDDELGMFLDRHVGESAGARYAGAVHRYGCLRARVLVCLCLWVRVQQMRVEWCEVTVTVCIYIYIYLYTYMYVCRNLEDSGVGGGSLE